MEFIRDLKGEQLVRSTPHMSRTLSLFLSLSFSNAHTFKLVEFPVHCTQRQPSQNDKDGKWFSSLWENIFYLVSLKDIMKVLYI